MGAEQVAAVLAATSAVTAILKVLVAARALRAGPLFPPAVPP